MKYLVEIGDVQYNATDAEETDPVRHYITDQHGRMPRILLCKKVLEDGIIPPPADDLYIVGTAQGRWCALVSEGMLETIGAHVEVISDEEIEDHEGIRIYKAER